MSGAAVLAPLDLDALAPIDYGELDPGVRRLVRLLRSNGFNTSDSGDGSKAGMMECAVDEPMVAIEVDPAELVSEAHRLHALLAGVGVTLGEVGDDGVGQIQASYDPANRIASVVLFGVTDANLPAAS